MPDLLPPIDGRAGAPRPLPVSYATPPPAPARRPLATAAAICAWLFIAMVVAAGVMHPAIPAVLLLSFVLLPLAGVVLGLMAKPRVKSVIAFAGVELGLVAGVALLLPNLCRSSEQANLVKCASNLRQIGWALSAYADRHDGRYPAGLDELITDSGPDLTADVLICPSTADVHVSGTDPQEVARQVRDSPGHISYVYVAAGLTRAQATPGHVIAYDKPHNHKNGGIEVLYGDMHVDYQPKKAADRIVAELTAGHNPPRPAGNRSLSP